MFEIYTVHILSYIYTHTHIYIHTHTHTHTHTVLFSCVSLYLQICVIPTRVLEKASHSCNQQSLDEIFNFIWQEQELIPQNSLVKVRDKLWDRLLYRGTESPPITTHAGIAALCCHHIQHAIYSDCKETTCLIEIILCFSSKLNSTWPTSHHLHTF